MGDIDNQFQPSNQTTPKDNIRSFQRNKVARQDTAVSNEEAQAKHHLSTYTEGEKKWLIKVEDEQRRKDRGFMQRMKRRWAQQFPERMNISRQNLRDNVVWFRN